MNRNELIFKLNIEKQKIIERKLQDVKLLSLEVKLMNGQSLIYLNVFKNFYGDENYESIKL